MILSLCVLRFRVQNRGNIWLSYFQSDPSNSSVKSDVYVALFDYNYIVLVRRRASAIPCRQRCIKNQDTNHVPLSDVNHARWQS